MPAASLPPARSRMRCGRRSNGAATWTRGWPRTARGGRRDSSDDERAAGEPNARGAARRDGGRPPACGGGRVPRSALHLRDAARPRRHAGVFAADEFLACASKTRVTALETAQRAVSPDDVCYILNTSGSTATPKGVTLAHGGVIDNGCDIGERQHLTSADRLWLAV